jgi:hypothetical protein
VPRPVLAPSALVRAWTCESHRNWARWSKLAAGNASETTGHFHRPWSEMHVHAACMHATLICPHFLLPLGLGLGQDLELASSQEGTDSLAHLGFPASFTSPQVLVTPQLTLEAAHRGVKA